jgi:hypothetical protein
MMRPARQRVVSTELLVTAIDKLTGATDSIIRPFDT